MHTLNSRFRDGTLLKSSVADRNWFFFVFNAHAGTRDMQEKFTLVFELTLALKIMDNSSESAAMDFFIFE